MYHQIVTSVGQVILLLGCALTVVLGAATAASAASGRNVLVVANAGNADSVRIAEYYCRKRAIPDEQLLRLTTLAPESADGIDRGEFERAIQAPIAAWLAQHQAQDRIHFIVLTKGIPLRINGGKDESAAASVDSELSLLYRRMTGEQVGIAGPLPNPYFLGTKPLSEARLFTRNAFSLYLVTRLDGFTPADVIGLIDRAASPSTDGRFILDGKASFRDAGNGWLRQSADRLRAAGLPSDRVAYDESATVLTDQVDVLGYYSWGSNDPAITRRDFNLSFQPGAIGGMFVSTDGRTFREPPPDWKLPSWTDKASWFAGTPQSLAGDLIRAGITGVSGHVAEPLLGNTIRPEILFPAYLAGFSLAEAYYLAMPSLSWMTVVVGDPLCSPFGKETTAAQDDVPLDPATELPELFSRRRLAMLQASGPALETAQLLLRAESRVQRGDRAGSKADLERATATAPTMIGAQFQLATMYQADGDYDAAFARYRKILEASPEHAMALNNLAYGLAVRKGNLKEALPLADRARTLAPKSGEIADTLGWLVYMSGEGRRAALILTEASVLSPANAEIHLHLAQVRAGLGDSAGATSALTKALELDPSLGSRPEVKALQSR